MLHEVKVRRRLSVRELQFGMEKLVWKSKERGGDGGEMVETIAKETSLQR